MTDEPTTAQWEAIERAIAEGRTIEAIKVFREATRCGLAEAKTVIDRHAADLRERDPARFGTRKAGCATILALALALTLLTAALFP